MRRIVLLVIATGCGRLGFTPFSGNGDGGSDGDGSSTDPVDITGLVALYHFDEPAWTGVADEVTDSSGLFQHGIADNGATTAIGHLGTAADFDQVNAESVTFGDVLGWEIDPPFTLVMWLNVKSLPTQASYRIASKSDANGNQEEWEWSLDLATSRLVFERSVDGGATSDPTAGVLFEATDIGRWIHCAIVVDAAGAVREFRDGILATTGTIPIPTIFHGTASARIGRRMPDGRKSSVLIDELAIWSRALADAEIANLHERQASGDPASAIPDP